jgi:hypothetical protein
MPTTWDLSAGVDSASVVHGAIPSGSNRGFQIPVIIGFGTKPATSSAVNIALGTQPETPPYVGFAGIYSSSEIQYVTPVAGDTIKLCNVPAGVIITRIRQIILVAGTASGTAAVGDASGASSWAAAAALDAAAGTMTASVSGTDAYALNYAGKLYTAATPITVLIAGATMITGIVAYLIEGIDVR